MLIKISEKITEILNERVKNTAEFEDIEEYINYILKQVAEKLQSESREEPTYSKEDEEKIKNKLKDLGYLD
jgi:lipoate-protein ligase A